MAGLATVLSVALGFPVAWLISRAPGHWRGVLLLAVTFPLLLGTVVLTVAVSALAAGAVSCPSGHCGDDPAKISLTGIYLGQALIAIMAVLAVSGEYSTGMIRVTLTAMPGRITVLAAKAAITSRRSAALSLPCSRPIR